MIRQMKGSQFKNLKRFFSNLPSTFNVKVNGTTELAGAVTQSGADTVTTAQITTLNIGAKNGSTVSCVENLGVVNKTTLTLTATPITITKATTVSGGGGVKVYDFPEGYIKVLGVTTNLTTADAVNGSWVASMGSVVSSTDGTLTSTEANILASTTATTSAGVGTVKGKGDTVAALDGTATAIDGYLNFAIGADATGGETMTVSGTITIHWIQLGDN